MKFSSLLITAALLLSVIFFACTSTPVEMKVQSGSIDQALEKAAKENKYLMAVVGYEGCRSCNKLVAAANHSDTFKTILENCLIYDFNVAEPGNQWFDQWLFDKAYPTTCLFSPQGKLLTIIKHGNLTVIKDMVAKALQNPTDTAIYRYFTTRLPYRSQELIPMMEAAFNGYRILNSNADKRRVDSVLAQLLSGVRSTPYFFNTYVASKLYKKAGNDQLAAVYADSALKFRGPIDAMLYPALRAELKFQSDSAYSQYDDPYLAIDKTSVDLGEIKSDEHPAAHFKIKNTGKKPLTIREVKVSCNCTVAEWPEKPILPGREAEVRLVYNPKHEGTFKQSAFILSNAFNSAVTISINGYTL